MRGVVGRVRSGANRSKSSLLLLVGAEQSDGTADLVETEMEGGRQCGKDAPALLRSDRHQGRDDALELGLKQIDEREFLLDAVHHIDDELRAGIRHPGLDRTSLLDVAAKSADGLVIGDIPGIDLVAVHEEYAGISDSAEKAGAVERPVSGARVHAHHRRSAAR